MNKKKSVINDVLQITRKTPISEKERKAEATEDRQEESGKERSNEVMPFPRWGKLNLPRLKIQSWRFEKKEGGQRAKGKREDERLVLRSDSDRDGVRVPTGREGETQRGF